MGFFKRGVGFTSKVYWDDVPPRTYLFNPAGAAVAPTVDADGYLLFNDNAITDIVYLFQVPHKWKIGSKFNFHIHGKKVTAATGNVDLKFKYQEIPIGGVQSTYSAINSMVKIVDSGDTVNHGIWSYDITPSATLGISGMIAVYISRDASAGNATDTYAGAFKIYDADLHMQFDDLGSKTEYTK